tara:strand:- start:3567 stop:5642 length:2076 start_codon:yes stop_codon:yes gene_type:complete
MTGYLKSSGDLYDGFGEEELAKKIAERFRRCREMKLTLHDVWWTSLAFVHGRQYVLYKGGSPIEPKAPSWRVRLVHNICRPIVRTAVAKLTQNNPGFAARPTGPDEDAIQRAKARTWVASHIARELDLQDRVAQLVWWGWVTGTAFFSWGWNPAHGPMAGSNRAGFPDIEVWSPFDVYPDWRATSLKDAEWVIRVHPMQPAQVKAQFDRFPDEQSSPGTYSGSGQDWDFDHDNYDSTLRREIAGYTEGGPSMSGKVNVFEYEEAATLKHPRGRRVITSEGVVLEYGPLMNDRYSLAMFRAATEGGRFFGVSPIEDVVPLQRELNRTLSQAIELRNMHTMPNWVAPVGSLHSTPENRPDEVVEYNPNMGPAPMRQPATPIPPSLFEMVASLKQSFYDISGIHEVSQGRSPSGVVSGRAIGMLSDQDQEKLGPMVLSLERAITDAGTGSLWLWKRFSTEAITTEILGDSRRVEAIRLHASDLDASDVYVVPNSMLPQRPSFIREQILNYASVGLLGDIADPRTRMRIQKMLQGFGIDMIEGDETQDRNYARQENYRMSTGEELEPSWFEDQVTHIDEHLAYMLSPEYQELTDQQQRGFEVHLATHYHELAKQGAGQATYAHVLGLDPQGGEQAQQETPVDTAPSTEQTGAVFDAYGPSEQPRPTGGGTPELNRAVNPAGPGVNATEERAGPVQ